MLLEKMKTFSARTQQQWGVPEELVSPLGWQSAIFELAGLEHNLTPSTQLHVLTRAVKAIYNEFKHVVLPQLKAKGISQSCIAADDLVPIFMYIFCLSNLKHPMRSRDLMWSLCHPDQLQGEGGYYLTVYESSIEFVLNEEITRDSFAYSYGTGTPSEDQGRLFGNSGTSRLSLGAGGGAGGGGGGGTGRDKRTSTGSNRSSGALFSDAKSSPFDLSSELHIPAGMTRGRTASGSSGSHASTSRSASGNSANGAVAGQAVRHASGVSAADAAMARHSGGRDSVMSTLAHRLTLSNLLVRKPAADNTTRESFN